jgi:hypothetical protein
VFETARDYDCALPNHSDDNAFAYYIGFMPMLQTAIVWKRRSSAALEKFLANVSDPSPVRWDAAMLKGLFALLCLWAILFATTWGRWGDVTIDSGREIYVPWELLHGKTLYRDIQYPYGPLAPYLNSVLYQLIGVNLSVLYWAGSLSALARAILLYMIGSRISYSLAGWIAGAVALGEAFVPGEFNYPLPYSFAAVYGSVATCLCLWCAVNAADSARRIWLFACTFCAAAALLCKLEMGLGCWVVVGALVAIRSFRTSSWRNLLKDVLAITPALAICLVTVSWMISLGGADFLLQQNLTGLPTTPFAKEFGARWNRVTGAAFDTQAVKRVIATVPVLFWYVAAGFIIRRFGAGARVCFSILGTAVVFGLIIALTFGHFSALPFNQIMQDPSICSSTFLPPAIIFFILATVPFLIVLVRTRMASSGVVMQLILVIGAGLVAARTLFKTYDFGYSIFYNGPVILSFLIFVSWFALPRTPGVTFEAARRTPGALLKRPADIALFLPLLAIVFVPVVGQATLKRSQLEPWKSPRGLIFLPKGKSERYEAAVRFMQAAAQRGESTLSVPEDAALYFFSGIHCPVRFYAWTPGVIPKGQVLDQLISQIEEKQVRYLIWSNRRFPEYGTPEFGRDFYQPIGDYFRRNFRPVSSLPGSGEWSATIWERVNRQELAAAR